MIEITLKLDDESVKAAVSRAWSNEFSSPSTTYSRSNVGAGWAEVTRQVTAHIETLDLTDYIRHAAQARIAGVVDEIVTIALRDRAKKLAKEMAITGTLLPPDPN